MIATLLPIAFLGALILIFAAPIGTLIFGLALIACVLLAAGEGTTRGGPTPG